MYALNIRVFHSLPYTSTEFFKARSHCSAMRSRTYARVRLKNVLCSQGDIKSSIFFFLIIL